MQGLRGKGFSQTMLVEVGLISYLVHLSALIIARFSQKTKKVALSIEVYDAKVASCNAPKPHR